MEEKGAEALVALVRGEVDDAGAAGPPSSKTTAVLVEAAWCLRLLTEDLVVRRKVADTGAIEALVELAARSAPAREPDVVTERVLERVAWALRNLAKDKITRKRVAKAGGAAQLVALAARSTHRGVLEEVRRMSHSLPYSRITLQLASLFAYAALPTPPHALSLPLVISRGTSPLPAHAYRRAGRCACCARMRRLAMLSRRRAACPRSLRCARRLRSVSSLKRPHALSKRSRRNLDHAILGNAYKYTRAYE